MLFSGQGKLYAAIAAAGVPGAFRFVGNCSTLALQLTTQTSEHKESTSGQRLTDARLTIEKSAGVQIVLDQWTMDNLALAMYGTKATETGSTVTGETLPDGLAVGDIVRLKYPDVSSVVVNDSDGVPATLVAGTDYRINSAQHGSIEILNIGTYVQPFTVDYTYGDFTRMGMFTANPPELWLRFEGLNTADGNNPVLVEIYRTLLDPLGQADLISDDFGVLDLSGSALYDAYNEADPQLGPFGRVVYLGAG